MNFSTDQLALLYVKILTYILQNSSVLVVLHVCSIANRRIWCDVTQRLPADRGSVELLHIRDGAKLT